MPIRTFFLSLALLIGYGHTLYSFNRGSSAPFISGDTFRSYADHVFDETTLQFDPLSVKFGDVIFVKTDWEYLEEFFTQHHPKIASGYILITHNSDHSVPGPFASYLDDHKLLGWFSQNIEGDSHPKLHPIPIGIANKCWKHGNPEIFEASLHLSENDNRPFLCYLNFNPATYPKERLDVESLFAEQPWCVVSPVKELSQYCHDLSKSKFVLSPRGNGLDCHRTWEALLMGAIPVVRSSTLDPLFADLPVLIVDDWRAITESYLNEQYEVLKLKPCNRKKLFINYWIMQIQSEVESCKD